MIVTSEQVLDVSGVEEVIYKVSPLVGGILRLVGSSIPLQVNP